MGARAFKRRTFVLKLGTEVGIAWHYVLTALDLLLHRFLFGYPLLLNLNWSTTRQSENCLLLISVSSRVESCDIDGCYFVVFDARYRELEYLLFQIKGYVMAGPEELDGFHIHSLR